MIYFSLFRFCRIFLAKLSGSCSLPPQIFFQLLGVGAPFPSAFPGAIHGKKLTKEPNLNPNYKII